MFKVYRVPAYAPEQYRLNAQPDPTPNQEKTIEVLQEIAGKEFVALQGITGSGTALGFQGYVHLHVGNLTTCTSQVFVVSDKYIEDTGKTVEPYHPPIDVQTSEEHWSKGNGYFVVRLMLQGSIDGFCGFTKRWKTEDDKIQ